MTEFLKGRKSCQKCGVKLGGQNIPVTWTSKWGWICADRLLCRWRRKREFQKRQLSFNWG